MAGALWRENLKSLTKQLPGKQADIAFHLGVSQQTISNWGVDKSSPNIEQLIEITKFFGITLDDFLTKNLGNVHLTQKRGITKNVHQNVLPSVQPNEELSPNSQQLYEHYPPFTAHSSDRKDVVAVQELIRAINAGLQGISGLLELSSQVSELRAEVAALKNKQAAG